MYVNVPMGAMPDDARRGHWFPATGVREGC